MKVRRVSRGELTVLPEATVFVQGRLKPCQPRTTSPELIWLLKVHFPWQQSYDVSRVLGDLVICFAFEKSIWCVRLRRWSLTGSCHSRCKQSALVFVLGVNFLKFVVLVSSSIHLIGNPNVNYTRNDNLLGFDMSVFGRY